MATLQPIAPAFFTFDNKYLAATHSDNSYVGKSGLFPTAPGATTPARPGETIVLYGTGFGPTNPAIAGGQVTDKVANVTSQMTITIGNQPATVSFAALVPSYAALYQFNVQVPASLPDGDQPVTAQIGSVTSLTSANCCFVTVQK